MLILSALKTKGNTPKYGIIYHSSFIGRASAKNKGRISRYLANKCSIASRVDSFIDEPTNAYGLQLREQVEERLLFYDNGTAPRKNIDVMESVASNLRQISQADQPDKKGKKRKSVEEPAVIETPSKDKKKSKKNKVEEVEEVVVQEPEAKKKKSKKAEVEVEEVVISTDDKKKKKKKDKA
jgi:nucleolar protein 56